MTPSPRHFHKLDANWVKDYDWRIEPNIGPYQISRLEKGRYIELERVENWWGEDSSTTSTASTSIRSDSTSSATSTSRTSIFCAASSTASCSIRARRVGTTKRAARSSTRASAGRIQFYNDVPRYARGFWLNLDDPLMADKNVRYGLAHSLNIDRAISTIFRGDYSRLHSAWQGSYGATRIRRSKRCRSTSPKPTAISMRRVGRSEARTRFE